MYRTLPVPTGMSMLRPRNLRPFTTETIRLRMMVDFPALGLPQMAVWPSVGISPSTSQFTSGRGICNHDMYFFPFLYRFLALTSTLPVDRRDASLDRPECPHPGGERKQEHNYVFSGFICIF